MNHIKQTQYDAIIRCIHFGAPALAEDLISAFNVTVQNSNDYINQKMQEQADAQKAKMDAERAAKEKAANEKAAKEANLGMKKSTK